MKLNLGFIWICILFVIPFSSALSSEQFSLYSGDSYNFEGHNIYFIQSSASPKLMVQVDSKTDYINYPVSLDEFEASRYSGDSILFSSYPSVKVGDIKVSLKEICFNLSKSNCGRVNDIQHFIEPKYVFEVSYFEPKVKVETSYSKDDIWLGDEFYVTTVISNVGDVDLVNFSFFENYPSSVKISSINDAFSVNDGIKFSKSFMGVGSTYSFRYKVKLVEEIAYSLRGEYSYYYKNEKYEGYGPLKSISLRDIARVSFTAPSSVNINEKFNVNISVSNLAEGNLDSDLVLDVPFNYSLKSRSKFKLVDGKLVFSDSLKKGETYSELIEFLPKEEGDFVLNLYVDSKYKVSSPSKIISKKVKVISESLLDLNTFDIKLNSDISHVLEGDLVQFELFLTKGNFDLKDVFVNISCPDLNMTMLLEKDLILAKENYYNFFSKVNMPYLNKSREVKFTVYVTGFIDGVKVNKSSELKLSLYDLADAFTLTREIPSKLNQGEVGIVKVKIKNNVERSFSSVIARDIVPSDFLYKDVKQELIFNLLPLEEKQLYSYEIKAPYYLNKSSIVRGILIFKDFNVTKDFSLNVFVNLKKANIDLTSTLTGDLFVGGRFLIDYNVQNNDGVDIRNLSVVFPLSTNADFLVNALQKSFIESLGVLENVKFFGSYLNKVEGDSELEGGYFSYYDIYGNYFVEKIPSKSISILPGNNACFIVAEKKLGNLDDLSGRRVPFIIDFISFCDSLVDVNLLNPKLHFSIPADSKKSISFNEYYLGNFTLSNATIYQYNSSSFEYKSVSNSVSGFIELNDSDVKNAVVTTTVNSNKTSSASSSSGTGINPDTPSGAVQLENLVDVSMVNRLFGLIGGIMLVIFITALILKSVKSFATKDHSKKMVLESDSKDVTSNVNVPVIKDGLDSLEQYISFERKLGSSEIDIEQKLFNAGWSKEVINDFMAK